MAERPKRQPPLIDAIIKSPLFNREQKKFLIQSLPLFTEAQKKSIEDLIMKQKKQAEELESSFDNEKKAFFVKGMNDFNQEVSQAQKTMVAEAEERERIMNEARFVDDIGNLP
jgi:hypothetical protein